MSTENKYNVDDLFGDRLRSARKSRELSQDNLADLFEISKDYVSKMENGVRSPSVHLKKALERWIANEPDAKGNMGRITSGMPGYRSTPEQPNVSPGPTMEYARRVPVISWVQAGDWSEVYDPYQPGHAEDWISTTETTHSNAFALIVRGDSMEPEFIENDIITVDPGRPPINGSYVIAKNGQEATFKQLVIDGENVYLKPLNNRYPIKDVTGLEIRIVGVVVEKRKRY
jgi:SOS-response transcriptional repressor LexA